MFYKVLFPVCCPGIIYGMLFFFQWCDVCHGLFWDSPIKEWYHSIFRNYGTMSSLFVAGIALFELYAHACVCMYNNISDQYMFGIYLWVLYLAFFSCSTAQVPTTGDSSWQGWHDIHWCSSPTCSDVFFEALQQYVIDWSLCSKIWHHAFDRYISYDVSCIFCPGWRRHISSYVRSCMSLCCKRYLSIYLLCIS